MDPQLSPATLLSIPLLNVLQPLHSKVAPERVALGVREFHFVCVSEAVRWLRRRRWRVFTNLSQFNPATLTSAFAFS